MWIILPRDRLWSEHFRKTKVRYIVFKVTLPGPDSGQVGFWFSQGFRLLSTVTAQLEPADSQQGN